MRSLKSTKGPASRSLRVFYTVPRMASEVSTTGVY